MARHAKHAQRHAKGCKICGDKTVGRGIEKHVRQGHNISYDAYKACFGAGTVILDKLEQTGTVHKTGEKVMMHILIRKFTV